VAGKHLREHLAMAACGTLACGALAGVVRDYVAAFGFAVHELGYTMSAAAIGTEVVENHGLPPIVFAILSHWAG
jgi:hypothetical protein